VASRTPEPRGKVRTAAPHLPYFTSVIIDVFRSGRLIWSREILFFQVRTRRVLVSPAHHSLQSACLQFVAPQGRRSDTYQHGNRHSRSQCCCIRSFPPDVWPEERILELHRSRWHISTMADPLRNTWGTNPSLVLLRAISFSFGCLSLFGVLFAYYWFLRMRRSFRHE
jgi:hypothetical protein